MQALPIGRIYAQHATVTHGEELCNIYILYTIFMGRIYSKFEYLTTDYESYHYLQVYCSGSSTSFMTFA